MYYVSAQGVDERMINVYYYCICVHMCVREYVCSYVHSCAHVMGVHTCCFFSVINVYTCKQPGLLQNGMTQIICY